MALKPKAYAALVLTNRRKKIYILCVKEHSDKEITGWDELSFYRLFITIDPPLYNTLSDSVFYFRQSNHVFDQVC